MPEKEGLIERFAALVPRMREETLRAWTAFLDDAEASGGGSIVMRAPSKQRNRDLPDAAYRSGSWNDLTG